MSITSSGGYERHKCKPMDFNEDFVQAVWKYQYFEKRDLETTHGQSLIIQKIGFQNNHEGPDFLESQVVLDKVEFFGNIEVHVKASDWQMHRHQEDSKYDSVILHVVWEDDMEVFRNDGSRIPTLELKGKVLLDVIRNYRRLARSRKKLLCGDFLPEVQSIIKFSMLEKALVERLHEKSTLIRNQIQDTAGDWEEVAYRWLFYCFGFKVNSDAMLKLAQTLPYKILKKHGNQPLVQEALLLGQAGFCYPSEPDDYTAFVRREYEFYKKKYSLPEPLYPSEWKFMRVRPTNYPSIRIAQLVAVLNQSSNLFSLLTSSVSKIEDLIKLFQVTPHPYWQHHYQLSKESKRQQPKMLSNQMIQLLGINFVVPLWYAYGGYIDDSSWKERCFDFLQQIPAEANRIIEMYQVEDWSPENAFDTQGMIGLHHNYCNPKKCLNCKIGQNLLRPRKS